MLECWRRCGGTSNLHALFLLNYARLVLALALEEMFPPVGDGEDRANTLK
jgi:hypothetical protein